MQDRKKRIHAKKIRHAGLLLAVLLLFAGCTKKEELLLLREESASLDDGKEGTEESPDVPDAAAPAKKEPAVIYVHVCGAVVQSGVYELEAGSRVYEAVQAAGGFAEGADENYVNQAQELEDGIRLVIPTLEEAAKARAGELSGEAVQENAANDSDCRININTASEAKLCEIPGIGATRAAAIAAYRESHGGFQKPEDIMKVSGIKEGMYEKIKDSISVN